MAEEESKTRVTILTANYRIKGYIDLLPGARVTDYIVEAKDFIAVTEAEVWDAVGKQIFTAPFIDVNREHIQVIAPGSH